MNTAFLGLGSNMGNREQYLEEALALIAQKTGSLTRVSSVYETEAWGLNDQPGYLNMVVQISTDLFPLSLLREILAIEKALGRERKQKWGSRTIDIDLLFYEDYHFQTIELVVPHPWIADRRFVLAPLAEIAPGFIHPDNKKNVDELLQACPDQSGILKV